MIVIEISDAGKLALDTELGALLQIDQGTPHSPGYAVSQPNRVLTGQAARAASRLFPTKTENRFWDALNSEALARPLPYAGTNAELAYLHLQLVWQNLNAAGRNVVLAVPGFYGRDELGLLIGIADELKIPVKGVVDLALAAPLVAKAERTLVHVDLHLHRARVSTLNQDSRLSVGHTEETRAASWAGVHDTWIRWIADEFVQATRFDPLYSAETEQQLFDRLELVVSALMSEESGGSKQFELEAGGQVHGVRLERTRLLEQTRPAVEALCASVDAVISEAGEQGAHLLLSHRAAGLPGLRERLADMPDVEVELLPAGASASGAAAMVERMPAVLAGSGASLIHERPWDAGSSLSTPEPEHISGEDLATIPPSMDDVPSPTHVVYRGQAHRIGDTPLVIGRELSEGEDGITTGPTIKGVSRRHCSVRRQGDGVVLEDHSTFGTYLDEHKLKGGVLPCQSGQVIRLVSGGEELWLINVES